MRILYLDTSSSFLYCGVVDDDKLIDKIALELKQDLSTETLYNIQLMFNKNNIDVHSIDKIMVVKLLFILFLCYHYKNGDLIYC